MEWILCNERLPKEGQMVLTTIRGHDVIILQEGETIVEAIDRIWNDVCYVSVGFIGSDGWYGADGFPEVVHPIAWMPLPKPYMADRKTEPQYSEDDMYWLSLAEDVANGKMSDAGANQAWLEYINRKDEPTISKMEQVEGEFKEFSREDLILLIECQKERITELLKNDEPQAEGSE